jgi:hypothetical protein
VWRRARRGNLNPASDGGNMRVSMVIPGIGGGGNDASQLKAAVPSTFFFVFFSLSSLCRWSNECVRIESAVPDRPERV